MISDIINTISLPTIHRKKLHHFMVPVIFLLFNIPSAHTSQLNHKLDCRDISGVFTATRDQSCQLLRSPARHGAFADMEFLAEMGASNVCSTAVLEGYLGRVEIIGESAIAQATDPYPPINDDNMLAIGANAIKIKSKQHGRLLGEIFVRHYVHFDVPNNYFSEELVMVSGSGLFSGARGTIRLFGNLFTGADMSGTICTRW